MNARVFSFVGAQEGPWCIVNIKTIIGEPLAHAERLHILAGAQARRPEGMLWQLQGVTSNDR